MKRKQVRLFLLLIVLRELSVRADFVVNFEGSVSLAVIGAAALLFLIKNSARCRDGCFVPAFFLLRMPREIQSVSCKMPYAE